MLSYIPKSAVSGIQVRWVALCPITKQKDHNEMNNLCGKKRYKRIASKLTRKLNALIAQYEDEDAKKILLKWTKEFWGPCFKSRYSLKNTHLNKIKVTASDSARLKIFLSGLYHTMIDH